MVPGSSVAPPGARPQAPAAALARLLLAAVVVLTTACASLSGPPRADVLQPQSAEEFRQIVRAAPCPVLAVFTSDSCVTCRTMRPVLAGLAEDYAGRLTVVQADLAMTGALIGEYNLLKVPTVLVLRNGREVARRHGLLPAPLMASFVRDALRERP
jgi:thioredoxin 1